MSFHNTAGADKQILEWIDLLFMTQPKRFLYSVLQTVVWLGGLFGSSTILNTAAQPDQQSPIRISVRKIADLPNALGVAGPFCGLIDNCLVVAGGANFPDRPPWEGGTKVWQRDVYLLDSPSGTWKRAGELPRPLGYGVSISVSDGLMCIGGSDRQQHYADVSLLQLDGGTIRVVELTPLPIPLANMAGALVGSTAIVGGGNFEPGEKSASARYFALDVGIEPIHSKRNQWREIERFPGEARILAQAASLQNAFYVFGGIALVQPDDVDSTPAPRRKYLKDGWRWNAKIGWTRIADLPTPLAASPTPCPSVAVDCFLVAGGDDGSRLDFQPVSEHPGFSNQILVYHASTDRWVEAGAIDTPRVTTGFVPWNGKFVIPSGEVRPGVRSPEVCEIEIFPHQSKTSCLGN